MKKSVFFSLFFFSFLSFSTQVKSSNTNTDASDNLIACALVAAAGFATALDLLTGQEGSIKRALVGGCCMGLTLTNSNEFTPVSVMVAAGIIGNHYDNLRNRKYRI